MTLHKTQFPATEVRFAPVASTVSSLNGLISGYGSTFGGDPDSYGDVIAPGAFAKSLAAHKAAGSTPQMFWAHEWSEPIGRWTDVREDANGLYVEGQLNPDVQRGREAIALIKQGAVTGLSIGFNMPAGARTRQADGSYLLREISLVEVSIVPIPANSRARVTGLKSVRTLRDFEDFLRAHGAAKSMARTLALKGWRPEVTDNSQLIQNLAARMKAAADELRTKG